MSISKSFKSISIRALKSLRIKRKKEKQIPRLENEYWNWSLKDKGIQYPLELIVESPTFERQRSTSMSNI